MAELDLTSPLTPVPKNALTAMEQNALDGRATSYQDEVWVSTWKRRSAAYWAGSFMGMFFGAAFGAIAVGVAALATGAITAPLALAVIGAYAVAGILPGVALCTDVGSASGSTAGGLKEQDRRNIFDGKPIEGTAEWNREPRSALFNLTRGSKKLFNGKVGLTGAIIGLGVAALIISVGAPAAALGFFASMGVLPTLNPIVLPSLVATTSTLFGGFFGLDMPTISKNTVNLMSAFLSGKIFEKRQPTLDLQQTQKLGRSANVEPVVFKGGTMQNLVAPMGSYAGKDAGQYLEKEALRQFHDPNTSQQTLH